jgi:hypothetical protein
LRKTLKIISISVGVMVSLIVLIGMVVYIFFPGTPYYIYSQLKYKSLNIKMTDFDSYETNGNTQKVDMGKYSFCIPSSATNIETDGSIIYKDDNTDYTLLLNKVVNDVDISFLQTSGKSRSWWVAYFGIVPDSPYETERLLYSLNGDDFKLSNAEQSKMCMILAIEKEVMIFGQHVYSYDKNGIKGFLVVDPGILVFYFYNADELSKGYQMTFHIMEDKSAIYSTINSIQFHQD